MSKKVKALIILINLILLIFITSKAVLGTLVDIFDKSIDSSNDLTYYDDIESEAGRIVGIIQVVGTMVSVGMLIVLGIKYVLGSADQKAEYRKSMIPYLIGAVLIFAASNLTQIIYEWAKNL